MTANWYIAEHYEALPVPAEMNSWDAEAVNTFRIPEFTLMENASREAFHVLSGGLSPSSRILVLAGSGNNGGDGYALARHAHDAGYRVLVCHTKAPGLLRGAARAHARLASRLGVPFARVAFAGGSLALPARLNPCWADFGAVPHGHGTTDVVVDALLGTGFSGETKEPFRALIRYINSLARRAFIFSLDVPSGLNALTGVPGPEAVRAHATVTFEAAKIGLVLPQAREYTGKLHVRRIGIPSSVRETHPASFRLFAPRPGVLKTPSPFMHKGDAGRVLVIGGSRNYTGAPVLAALGALRGGAGLVTAASPEGSLREGRAMLPEAMLLALRDAGEASGGPVFPDAWSPDMIPELLAAIGGMRGKGALVLGPGLGREEAAMDMTRRVLAHAGRPPAVLDADGLFPLSRERRDAAAYRALLRKDDIITPHPGEAARLLGMDASALQEDRPGALRALCADCEAAVILKGAGSLVGQKETPIYLIPAAAPSLASGGSGDVLSGLCGAFLARGMPALFAAAIAAHIHARAGIILDGRYPARGNLAREIADSIPQAMAELA